MLGVIHYKKNEKTKIAGESELWTELNEDNRINKVYGQLQLMWTPISMQM